MIINIRRREADQERGQLLKLSERIIITLIDVAESLDWQSISFLEDEKSEDVTEEKLREHMSQKKIVLF